MEITESEKLRRLEQAKLDKIKHEQKKWRRRNTPLFDAIRKGASEVEKLINEGWDVNHIGAHGRTPLVYAIMTRAKNEVIEALIKGGAKIHETYFYDMMGKGRVNSFFVLLNAYNPTEEFYNELLDDSVNYLFRYDSMKNFFVKMFEYRKNFNDFNVREFIKRCEEGHFPLTFKFLSREEEEMLTYLLYNGEYINTSIFDETLLDKVFTSCLVYNREPIINLLIERGARFSGEGSLLAVEIIKRVNHEETVLKLLNNALPYIEDINAVDSGGKTAVMLALEKRFNKVYEFLISNGAEKDVFKQTKDIAQLIESVIKSNNLEVVAKLDNNVLNNVKVKGRSVLSLALYYNRRECKDILNLLMDKGAKFSSDDEYIVFVDDWLNDEPFLVRLIEAGFKVGDYKLEGRRGLTYLAVTKGKRELALAIAKSSENLKCSAYGAVFLASTIMGGNDELFYELVKVIDVKKCYDELFNTKEDSFFVCVEDYDINPLCAAIYKSKPKILETLLELGCQPKHHNEHKSLLRNVFCYNVAKQDRLEMINSLVNHGGKIFDWWYALTRCYPECIKLLVKLGLDEKEMNYIDEYKPKNNILMEVVRIWLTELKQEERKERLQDFAETIKFLLDIGVDCNYKNSAGTDALALACYFDDEDVVNLLLSLGCGDDKARKAYMASRKVFELLYGKERVEESEIEALYNEGADFQFMPDYITYPHYRRSALIIAIKNGHYNVLGTLMRLGADPFAKETYGKTFFDFFGDVSYSGCQEVINQLLPYVDKIGKELLFAVVGRGSFLVEQVRAVIEAGVDVNSLGENSSATPLLEACIARSTFIIDELVELGANVNEVYTGCVKRDKEEQDAGSLTILMAAALLGQERTVKLLLENGADVNFVNENGDNAITYLLKGSLNFRITGEFAFYNSFKNLDSYINIIELLLVSGLDLDHENNEGVSARMLIEEKFKTSKKLMNSIRKD